MGNYQKRTTRSKRKDPEVVLDPEAHGEMSETADGTPAVQMCLPVGGILAGIKGGLDRIATQAGLLVIHALIEDEVAQLAGPRYRHDSVNDCHRWGTEEGHVIMGGKKLPIKRPRVRDEKGEVQLDRYRLFNDPAAIQETMGLRILKGISTRNYGAVVDDLAEGYGIEKSSVSREFKAHSQKQLEGLLERPLGELNLVAIMIDGIEFAKTHIIAALGVDTSGKKHVLGLWSGATENATVCGELLDDCIERGLIANRRYLFVIDGSKALRKAIVKRWGDDALIQRCRLHKQRNVLSHLPQNKQSTVLMRLRAAWGMNDYKEAKKALMAVRDHIAKINVDAAKSLDEGFEETLTINRLCAPEGLRKSLSNTNLIESCFSKVRDLCKNVKRWRDVQMVRRWTGTALLETEKKFRRVRGYKDMTELIARMNLLEKDTQAA